MDYLVEAVLIFLGLQNWNKANILSFSQQGGKKALLKLLETSDSTTKLNQVFDAIKSTFEEEDEDERQDTNGYLCGGMIDILFALALRDEIMRGEVLDILNEQFHCSYIGAGHQYTTMQSFAQELLQASPPLNNSELGQLFHLLQEADHAFPQAIVDAVVRSTDTDDLELLKEAMEILAVILRVSPETLNHETVVSAINKQTRMHTWSRVSLATTFIDVYHPCIEVYVSQGMIEIASDTIKNSSGVDNLVSPVYFLRYLVEANPSYIGRVAETGVIPRGISLISDQPCGFNGAFLHFLAAMLNDSVCYQQFVEAGGINCFAHNISHQSGIKIHMLEGLVKLMSGGENYARLISSNTVLMDKVKIWVWTRCDKEFCQSIRHLVVSIVNTKTPIDTKMVEQLVLTIMQKEKSEPPFLDILTLISQYPSCRIIIISRGIIPMLCSEIQACGEDDIEQKRNLSALLFVLYDTPSRPMPQIDEICTICNNLPLLFPIAGLSRTILKFIAANIHERNINSNTTLRFLGTIIEAGEIEIVANILCNLVVQSIDVTELIELILANWEKMKDGGESAMTFFCVASIWNKAIPKSLFDGGIAKRFKDPTPLLSLLEYLSM